MKKILKRISGLGNDSKNEYEEELLEEEEYEETEDKEYDDEEYDDEETEDAINEENTKDEDREWLQEDLEEGQLSIDVFQTNKAIIVKSTIAGVKPADIDISINNDMLTIRGKRNLNEKIEERNYLYRECYWGAFSRSIILPVEIEAEKIEALLENGVLTVILPKAKVSKQISIKVKGK